MRESRTSGCVEGPGGNSRAYPTPYGTVTITRRGQTQSSDPLGQHWTYTGRFFDVESDLYYFRARYCHSGLGRFIERDPLGYTQGGNLFRYCESDPTNVSDPLGLGDFEGWGGPKSEIPETPGKPVGVSIGEGSDQTSIPGLLWQGGYHLNAASVWDVFYEIHWFYLVGHVSTPVGGTVFCGRVQTPAEGAGSEGGATTQGGGCGGGGGGGDRCLKCTWRGLQRTNWSLYVEWAYQVTGKRTINWPDFLARTIRLGKAAAEVITGLQDGDAPGTMSHVPELYKVFMAWLSISKFGVRINVLKSVYDTWEDTIILSANCRVVDCPHTVTRDQMGSKELCGRLRAKSGGGASVGPR